MNVLFQIKVDYTYEINSKNNKIKDASLYLSEGLKDKIRLKKEINIFVIGDSIAAGAQTTSQYFFNDREKDSFSGYLKETLEDYYKCTINMNNFSGGVDRYFLLSNINEMINQKPDLVIVEFGMNDHAIQNPLNKEITESFYLDMKSIVEIFQKSDIDVILVGFFQQNPEWEMENPIATDRYNELLKRVATESNIFLQIFKHYLTI